MGLVEAESIFYPIKHQETGDAIFKEATIGCIGSQIALAFSVFSNWGADGWPFLVGAFLGGLILCMGLHPSEPIGPIGSHVATLF